MLILAVVALGLATAVALWRLPLLHPAQLWLGVWFIALGLFALRLLPYRTLSHETLGLIAATSASFVAASLVGARLVGSRRRPPRLAAEHVQRAAAASLAVALVGCVAFIVQAIHQFGVRDTLVTSPPLRRAVEAGTYAVTIKYLYFALAASALCGVAAFMAPARRWRWLGCGGLAVASTYLATGRATVVVAALAAAIGCLVAAERQVSLRRLAFGFVSVGVLSLLLFTGMGQLVGKTYENSDLANVRSFFSEHPSAQPLGTPYMYVTAPVGALDLLVRDPPDDKSDGCAMFSTVCTVLSTAGLDTRPVPAIRPFTAAPIPWNTYTALDDVIRDVGVLVVPLVFAMIGLVCGALWRYARCGYPSGMASYALVATAIITSAEANTFTAAHILGATAVMLLMLAAAVVSLGLRR